MLKVAVGSDRRAKLDAVKIALRKCGIKNFEIIHFKLPEKLKIQQPEGRLQTLKGARIRAKYVYRQARRSKFPSGFLAIGIEGGLLKEKPAPNLAPRYQQFTRVFVIKNAVSKKDIKIATTSSLSFEIPKEVVKLYLCGKVKELGSAIEKIYGKRDILSYVTDGQMERCDYVAVAVWVALKQLNF